MVQMAQQMPPQERTLLIRIDIPYRHKFQFQPNFIVSMLGTVGIQVITVFDDLPKLKKNMAL